MKTDLNSLKKELGRLTDINYLKKELNRIAGEVKNFDKHLPISPKARKKVEQLEERFKDLLKSLSDLQKQVDENLNKLVTIVKGGKGRKKTARSTAKRASGKKTPRKTTRKTSKKAASR